MGKTYKAMCPVHREIMTSKITRKAILDGKEYLGAWFYCSRCEAYYHRVGGIPKEAERVMVQKTGRKLYLVKDLPSVPKEKESKPKKEKVIFRNGGKKSDSIIKVKKEICENKDMTENGGKLQIEFNMTNGEKLCHDGELNINPVDMDKVLCHASFQGQSEENRNYNKILTVIGAHLVKVVVAISAYSSPEDYSAKEINNIIDRCNEEVTRDIYSSFNLEEYLYCSEGELGKEHVEEVYKIVALFFLQNGLQRTIRLLEPFAENLTVKNDDYRTILQEYFQKNKISFSYEFVNQIGPQDSPTYIYRLNADRSSEGKGRSKKKAMADAASEYIKNYRIDVTEKKEKILSSRWDKVVFPARKAILEQLCRDLKINGSGITVKMINSVFTHKSAVNDNIGDAHEDNSALAVVGAELLQALSICYLLKMESVETESIMTLKNSYLKVENIANVMDDKCIDYLLKSKGLANIDESGKCTIKAQIFQACIGALAVTTKMKNSSYAATRTVEIASDIFDRISRIDDYMALKDAGNETADSPEVNQQENERSSDKAVKKQKPIREFNTAKLVDTKNGKKVFIVEKPQNSKRVKIDKVIVGTMDINGVKKEVTNEPMQPIQQEFIDKPLPEVNDSVAEKKSNKKTDDTKKSQDKDIPLLPWIDF